MGQTGAQESENMKMNGGRRGLLFNSSSFAGPSVRELGCLGFSGQEVKEVHEQGHRYLGARTLLGAPGLTTSNKTRGSWHRYLGARTLLGFPRCQVHPGARRAVPHRRARPFQRQLPRPALLLPARLHERTGEGAQRGEGAEPAVLVEVGERHV